MTYKGLQLGIVARTLLLAALLLAGAVLAVHAYYWNAATCLLLAGLAVAELIHYQQRSMRDFERLVASVQNQDFSLYFSTQKPGYRKLHQAYAELLDAYKLLNAEKAEMTYRLDLILLHLNTGLLVYDAEGNILLQNRFPLLWPTPRRNLRLHELLLDYPELQRFLLQMQAEKQVFELHTPGQTLHLLVRTSTFVSRGKTWCLATLQNIHQELEEKEWQSWQDISRMLIHEMMNSLTPILSLAATAHDLLDEAPDTHREEIRLAIHTLHQRARGLQQFVETYRHFTGQLQLQVERLSVHQLLDYVAHLMKAQCRAQLVLQLPPQPLYLTADRELLAQALINLIKNADEAYDEQNFPPSATIELSAVAMGSEVILSIADHGTGIADTLRPSLFIPFFSTKRQGSGVGLPLARQIVHLHGGQLILLPHAPQGTMVQVRLPALG